mgnify:CR=1 FL=1
MMTTADIIVIVLCIIIVVAVAAGLTVRKKKGKTGCCGDCSKCPSCAAAHGEKRDGTYCDKRDEKREITRDEKREAKQCEKSGETFDGVFAEKQGKMSDEKQSPKSAEFVNVCDVKSVNAEEPEKTAGKSVCDCSACSAACRCKGYAAETNKTDTKP